MKPSVIIIGAGPGGLTLANTLLQFGVKPLLLEKETEKSPFTKALTLQPRTLEVIDSLNLLNRFMAKGNVIRKTQFFANGSHVGSICYDHLPSNCGFLLSITQPESEKILENALETGGVSIQKGVTCTDIRIKDGQGLVKVKHIASGREDELVADYVIAADGGKSSMRSLFLKIGKVKLTHETRYDSNFIMGDFEMEEFPFPRDERRTYFKNQTIYGLIPMVFPFVRIVAFGLKGAKDLTPKQEEFALMTKEIIGHELDLTHGHWLSRFYPSRFMLDQFRIGPLFFIGDAAHIISPIGAQGINLSIEDGYNLGWKLGMVISNQVNLSILNTYQSERMAAAKAVMEETNQLHNKLSNPVLNFFFMQQLKLLKRPEISQLVLLKQTQFYIDYPDRQNSLKKKKPTSFFEGSRFINARCISPKKTFVFDHFPKDKWTIIINLENESDSYEQTLLESQSNCSNICCFVSISSDSDKICHGMPLHLLIDPKSILCERLQKSSSVLAISPDKYVYRTYTINQWREDRTFWHDLSTKQLLASASI